MVYWAPDPAQPDHWITYRFGLQSRVAPHILASVARLENGAFQYRYTVRNGPSAATAIWKWSVIGPVNTGAVLTHPAWHGADATTKGASQFLLPDAPTGGFLSWVRGDWPPIQPGGESEGFQIVSRFGPGLTTAYACGDGGLLNLPAEFTKEVEDQVIPLERPHVMRKPALTIGPRFAPNSSPDAIRRAYRADLDSLIGEHLVDASSAYIHELRQSLSGQPASIKSKPGTELEKEIDRALRVALE
jgi:hypothetical protein